MGINLASTEINVLNSCRYKSALVNLKTWEISTLKTMLTCLPLIIQVFGSWFWSRQIARTLPLPGTDSLAGLLLELFQRTVE